MRYRIEKLCARIAERLECFVKGHDPYRTMEFVLPTRTTTGHMCSFRKCFRCGTRLKGLA